MSNAKYTERYKKKMERLRETNPVPSVLMEDLDVERLDFDYSIRAPGDYVVSGPIAGRSTGKGRVFASSDDAEAWGRDYFGARYKQKVEAGTRWAMLIAKSTT